MEGARSAGKQTAPLSSATDRLGAAQSRLIIRDRISGIRFLVDTGADVSVLPSVYQRRKHKSNYTLYAANGSAIATYGQRLLRLDLGLRRVIQ